MTEQEKTERREFSFSSNTNPGCLVYGKVAPPLIVSIGLLLFAGHEALAGDYASVLMLSPFIAMPVVMAMIAYKTSFTDCVLRVRNEKVILDPPELIHIDFNGKEDFRCKFADIRKIEKVVWVQGDSTQRWTIYGKTGSFELRKDISYFFDIKEYLKEVVPNGVASGLP